MLNERDLEISDQKLWNVEICIRDKKETIAFRESWRNKELGQISLVRYRYSFATDLLSEQFAALWPVPYRNHRVLHVPCISISFSIDACLK